MAVFQGDNGPNIYTGTNGADQIYGAGGNDDLAGGAGGDLIEGGDGDDVLYSGARSPAFTLPYSAYEPYNLPLLDIGSEADTLRGGVGSDRIFGGYGDTIDGGDGNGGSGTGEDYLYISFLAAPHGITADFRQPSVTIDGGTISGIESFSLIQGSNYADDIRPGDGDGYSNLGSIFGMGGNDHLVAGYYTAAIFGGDGDDTLDGRNSGYLVTINGDAGNDTIYAGPAVADGGEGNDTIYSSGVAHGSAGNDHLIAQAGQFAILYGDAGDDILEGSDQGNYLSGGAGADTLTGGAGGDRMASGDFDTTNTPLLDAGLEHDSLSAGGGDDTLAIGYGDSADGGAGNDTLLLSLAGATSGVTINTTSLTSGGTLALGGGTIQSIEYLTQLTGSAFADTITVNPQFASGVTVHGGGGNDVITSTGTLATIYGDAGDDNIHVANAGNFVIGGVGADTLVGGSGDDRLFSGDFDGPNYLYGAVPDAGLEHDTLTGAGGNDILAIGYGDSADGGTGNDTLLLSLAGATSGVTVNTATLTSGGTLTLGGGTIQSIEYIPLVTGSAFGDSITMGTQVGAVTVRGGGGNDIITSGGSAVTMYGDDGDDRFISGSAVDTIDGGAGIDTVDYRNAAVGVTVQLALGLGSTSSPDIISNVENIDGSAFGDVLSGNSGDNVLQGIDGNDMLSGGLGRDTLSGGAGSDSLWGDEGDDILNGGDGADYLYGGQGSDILTGGLGNDFIDGGGGLFDTDTAVIAAATSDISSVHFNQNFFVVTSPDGADSIYRIKWLQLSDRTLDAELLTDIDTLYRFYGGRSPTVPELLYWHDQRAAGTTREGMRNAILDDPLGKAYTAASVDQIYREYLGRPATSGEVTFWDGQFHNGAVSGSVIYATLDDPAGKAHTSATVTQLYQDYLGRAPNAYEISYWDGQLHAGTTFAGIRTAILDDPAGKAHTSATVTQLYGDYLGRAPSAFEISYWDGQVHLGTSFAGVRNAILDDPSGQAHTSASVDALYRDYLGRAAASGEISYWSDQIHLGTTFAGVRNAVLDDPTGASYTASTVAGLYQHYFGRAPSSSEASTWNGLFHQGADGDILAVTLLSSSGSNATGVHRYTGTSAADRFDLHGNTGSSVITGFNPTADQIDLRNGGYTGINPLDAAHAHQVTALDGAVDVLINLDPNHAILINNVSLTQLHASDFLI